MKIKILGMTIPLWLLSISAVSAILIVSGIVIAQVNILQQHDFGYTKIGESRNVVILQSTNGSISKNSLNITTACNGTQSINANLLYYDPSGVARNQPLILDGTTTFLHNFNGNVTLVINSVQAGQWLCQLNFINDTSTFINFVEGFS